jgi:hypothetical protein
MKRTLLALFLLLLAVCCFAGSNVFPVSTNTYIATATNLVPDATITNLTINDSLGGLMFQSTDEYVYLLSAEVGTLRITNLVANYFTATNGTTPTHVVSLRLLGNPGALLYTTNGVIAGTNITITNTIGVAVAGGSYYFNSTTNNLRVWTNANNNLLIHDPDQSTGVENEGPYGTWYIITNTADYMNYITNTLYYGSTFNSTWLGAATAPCPNNPLEVPYYFEWLYSTKPLVTGGITTNVDCGDVTLLITNGIVMGVQ